MAKERRSGVQFERLTSYEGHGRGDTHGDFSWLFRTNDDSGLFTIDGVMLFVRFLIDLSSQTIANEHMVFPASLVSISIDEIERRAAAEALDEKASAVINRVAQALGKMTRQADKAGRHGRGFLVLLTRTMAKRVRDHYTPRTAEHLQEVAKSEGMSTTFSFGIASLTEHAIRDTDDMFRKSVRALEEARKQGPGSVVVYDFRTMPLKEG